LTAVLKLSWQFWHAWAGLVDAWRRPVFFIEAVAILASRAMGQMGRLAGLALVAGLSGQMMMQSG